MYRIIHELPTRLIFIILEKDRKVPPSPIIFTLTAGCFDSAKNYYCNSSSCLSRPLSHPHTAPWHHQTKLSFFLFQPECEIHFLLSLLLLFLPPTQPRTQIEIKTKSTCKYVEYFTWRTTMVITKRRQMKYATKASVLHENKLKKGQTQPKKTHTHTVLGKNQQKKMQKRKWKMRGNSVNKLLQILEAKFNAAATDNGPIFLTTN